MTINPPLSADAERGALIDSQAQYLQEYRKQLEKELTSLSNQALERWLKQSDREFKRVLKEAAELALSELTQQLNQSLSNSLNGISGTNSASAGHSSDFTQAVTQLVVSQVSDMLFAAETSIRQHETERSATQRQALKLSNSQRQAALARQNAQGQRNL